MKILQSKVADIFNKPPWIFPFIGGFHILWLAWTLAGLRGSPFGWPEIIRVGWMAGYTTFWLSACYMRKWGALGYMALTLLNTLLFILLKSPIEKSLYTSSIFLVDCLFCFFLLYFYKHFK